jgi:hypothetical protein
MQMFSHSSPPCVSEFLRPRIFLDMFLGEIKAGGEACPCLGLGEKKREVLGFSRLLVGETFF